MAVGLLYEDKVRDLVVLIWVDRFAITGLSLLILDPYACIVFGRSAP